MDSPVHWGTFSGIPGFYPLDPSNNPPVMTTKNVSNDVKCLLGAKCPPLRTTALESGCLLTVWLKASYLTSLGPTFIIYRVKYYLDLPS